MARNFLYSPLYLRKRYDKRGVSGRFGGVSEDDLGPRG